VRRASRHLGRAAQRIGDCSRCVAEGAGYR
jgi:hypothetical protein